MYHENGTTVVNKRMSFLAITVISLSMILITAIVSVTGLAVYGLRVLDHKSDSLVSLVGEAARALPEIRAALPPALADAINDVREPGYLKNVEIAARVIEGSRSGGKRIVVEVQNNGDEIVSLLSMRIIGLDSENAPLFERSEWAATPIQIEDDWRGPLLPRETRRFPVHCYYRDSFDELEKVACEVTDVRVWRGAPKQADEPVDEQI
ncbi:MAG TPA: hypothetical protein VNT79_15650 [Phycisphaerae bacterium]|nr:hypothetical protein [Phycisphaerae bacterium]